MAHDPAAIQFLFFAFVLVSAWSAERAFLRQPFAEKLLHTSVNLFFLALAAPIQMTMIGACIGIANWVRIHHWGLFWLLPHSQTSWIGYALIFLVLDFMDYVYHVMAHRVGFLWRLHLVHHSDTAMDVSTTFREHPCETLIRTGFLALCVFLCGAPIEVLALRQTCESVANVSQHLAFRLPPRAARIAGWLLVTPNLHHLHHHFQRPGTNCNYGDVFSIWDRLFNTLLADIEEGVVFGIDTHMGSQARNTLALLGIDAVIGWWRGRPGRTRRAADAA